MELTLVYSGCKQKAISSNMSLNVRSIYGLIAQLVERIIRIDEVGGSTPLESTKSP